MPAPDGGVWELYLTRSTGNLRWRPADYDVPMYDVAGGASLLWAVLEIPLFVVNQVLRPTASYLSRLPFVLARSRKADAWTVEAVCWWPHEQRFHWSVSGKDRERVLAEVAAGISEGRWAQPTGAVFHGELIP